MVLRTVVPGLPTLGSPLSLVPLLCKSYQLCLSVPGLDYVSHEDILPYTSTDQVPIQHELFERFLLYDQTKGSLSGKGKALSSSRVSEITGKEFLGGTAGERVVCPGLWRSEEHTSELQSQR